MLGYLFCFAGGVVVGGVAFRLFYAKAIAFAKKAAADAKALVAKV